ncbi:MAG: hypothetical protein NT011_00330 [Kiritimatiellaeota bacterium]|nr:hypothetical protein [Kiritimatiellota bacterium]
MKRSIIALPAAVVLLSSVFCAMAQSDDMPPPPPPCGGERPALTDMTVTGKVTKAEMQMPDGNTVALYVLSDSAGNTVILPGKHMGPPGGEQTASVSLEEYENKNVTIVGKGFQMERDGNKTTHLVVITKIDVVTTTSAAE